MSPSASPHSINWRDVRRAIHANIAKAHSLCVRGGPQSAWNTFGKLLRRSFPSTPPTPGAGGAASGHTVLWSTATRKKGAPSDLLRSFEHQLPDLSFTREEANIPTRLLTAPPVHVLKDINGPVTTQDVTVTVHLGGSSADDDALRDRTQRLLDTIKGSVSHHIVLQISGCHELHAFTPEWLSGLFKATSSIQAGRGLAASLVLIGCCEGRDQCPHLAELDLELRTVVLPSSFERNPQVVADLQAIIQTREPEMAAEEARMKAENWLEAWHYSPALIHGCLPEALARRELANLKRSAGRVAAVTARAPGLTAGSGA